jgi:hypothetical protein
MESPIDVFNTDELVSGDEASSLMRDLLVLEA